MTFEKSNTKNLYGFPYQPYPIQEQLMRAIYQSMDTRKIAILESPTGTGKSLSVICAAMSWLEEEKRRKLEDMENQLVKLQNKIKETEFEDDWMNAHSRKFEIEKELADVEEQSEYQRKIDKKLELSRINSKRRTMELKSNKAFSHKNKRKPEEDDNNFKDENFECNLENNDEDIDLVPDDTNEDKRLFSNEQEPPLRCAKIIYASRTHTQLEQFAAELQKTDFYPRILTVASRQTLCINDSVRALKVPGLVNDRCNELRNGTKQKTTEKRLKNENGAMTINTNKSCGCEFAKSEGIENLSDEILVRNMPISSNLLTDLIKTGKDLKACPYFASRNALPLCELILLPYNVLLHKATRQAWGVDLKDNVVIIDEAHNLLQTLSGIHAVELNSQQLEASCGLITDYITKFKSRFSARTYLNVRHLHYLANALLNLLQRQSVKNSSSETVFTLDHFLLELSCTDIDFFKLLEFLEVSNLCRKLRDFRLKYPDGFPQNIASTKSDESNKSKFNSILDKVSQNKKNNKKTTISSKEPNVDTKLQKNSSLQSSTPLYQLREFLEAITSPSEDARILVSTSKTDCSKFRFLLLNPADKLRNVVLEARSLILLGGTMRPVDQLIDAFERVCSISSERILQFSCGHVIESSQLIALSIAHAPNKTPLNINFNNRKSIISPICQTFVNLLRHVPNGAVGFFPSYGFLFEFVNIIKSTGELAQLQKIKPIFIESRDGEDVWPEFCKAAQETRQGAFLMAVVGGKLSEGINFSDELGRCVFMVGLPYANRNSAELSERIKYVEENIGAGAGSRFYKSLCMQAVNQAIGRVIRHRNDHAAIILLDARYSMPDIEESLPEWIKSHLTHCNQFPEALTKLIGFFRNIKQISS